jgi:hypothetical protein
MDGTLLLWVAQRIPVYRHPSGDMSALGWVVCAIGFLGFAYITHDLVKQVRRRRRTLGTPAPLEAPLEMVPTSFDPSSPKAWAFVVGLNLLIVVIGALVVASGKLPRSRQAAPPPVDVAPPSWARWTDVPSSVGDDATP